MSARPAVATFRMPRTQRMLGAALLCAAALFGANAWAQNAAPHADDLEVSLSELEQLAVRQPVAAAQQLDALLRNRGEISEHAKLHAEVVRLLIADAQTRSHDVLALAEQIHDRLEALGDARLQMQTERTRMGAYYELGQNDECWRALQEELKHAKRAKDDDLYAQALVDQAGFLIKRSDFEGAAAAVADASRHVRGAQEGAEVAFSNGLLERAIGDWANAQAAFHSAQEKFAAVGDRTGEADSLAYIGEALQKMGRPGEAMGPLTTAASDYEDVGNDVSQARVMRILALVYASSDQPTMALAFNVRATDALIRLNQPVDAAQARVERAGLLLHSGQPREALKLLDLARPVVHRQEDLQLSAMFFQTAAATHAALGKFRDAYEEMAQFHDAEDLKTEQLVARQLAAQRGRLESDRLSRENALLRAQASSSERALAAANRAAQFQNIALGMGALVVLGALAALWRQRFLLQRIARMAETDALTGMLNRRHVLDLGQRMMQRCRRDGRPCAMLMLDVDRFKSINDRYGHVAGDKALRAIAKVLNSCLRPGDQIGRYGGEEFAVILPGADAAEAGTVAERLRQAVANMTPDWAPGAEPLTVSGGIATATVDTTDFTDLLVRADQALYRAKDAGRNRMEFHGGEPVLAAA